jgi:hypothetical protein
MAMLQFYRMYLQYCEHLSESECVAALQSQFRATQRAQRVLDAFSRRLVGKAIAGDVDVDMRTVLQIVNRCGFCPELLNMWNTAAINANMM